MPVEKSLFTPKPKVEPAPAPTPAVEPVAVAPAPITPAPVPPQASADPVAPVTITLPSWLKLPSFVTIYAIVVTLALAYYVVPGFHIPRLVPDASITAPLKATLIFDADALDPTQTAAAIRGDATIAPALKQLGCDWRPYDKDAPTLASTGLVKYAGDPPTLVIQVEGVGVPAVHQHVTTPADVIAAVKKLRGAN